MYSTPESSKSFHRSGTLQHNPGNLLAGLGHVQGIHPGYHHTIVPMGVSSWGTRATTIRSSSGRQFPQFLQDNITWKHQIYTWQDLESQVLTPKENSFKEMTFLCRSGFDCFFQENGQFTQVYQVGQWSFLVFLRVERTFTRKSVLTSDVNIEPTSRKMGEFSVIVVPLKQNNWVDFIPPVSFVTFISICRYPPLWSFGLPIMDNWC